jgi:orotidine-5'-phosphate decarboxylase
MLTREAFLQGFKEPSDRIILALDDMSHDEADDMMRLVGDYIGIAKENDGADIDGARDSVNRLADAGYVDMLDWKLHDTPGTVKNRTRNLASVGASLVTVHTPGGVSMLKAAVEGRDQALADIVPENLPVFLRDKVERIGGLLGITVLTSLSTAPGPNGGPSEVELATGGKLDEIVVRRTRWAAEAGLTGVVCSGEGLIKIRSMPEFDNLLAVVPGMVLTGGKANEGQQQISTPEAAFDAGADFVVAGSAVTQSEKKNGFPPQEAGERFAKAAERAF